MTSYDFKKKVVPILVKFGVGLGIGVFVIVLTQGWFFEVSFLKNIDLLTIDIRYQNRYDRGGTLKDVKNAGDVVIVGISDDDLTHLKEKFPFPRDYYAHLIQNLNRAGARAIVFDITFETPGRGDSLLRDALQKYDNVILAAKVLTGAGNENYDIRSLVQNYNNVFFDVDKQVGIVNINKDRDNVCRSYLPMVTVGDNLTPTLAFAALNRAFRMPALSHVKVTDDAFVFRDREIPKFEQQNFMLNYYGPNHTFRYVSFVQTIDDSTFQTKDEEELGTDLNMFDDATAQIFKNKIVFVGSVMAEERDYHNTPLYTLDGGKKNYTMNGVEIHATAVQNVLDRSFITRLDPMLETLMILGLAVAAFFGILFLKQLKFRYVWLLEIAAFVLVLLIIAGIFELSLYVFANNNVLVNVVNPSLAVALAYFGTAVYQYLTERQQKAMIKSVFSHYLNPAVVNELVTNPEKAKLGGDRRELTVFFSDIASFTTISEQFQKNPEGLVDFLNEYLGEMTSIIFKFDGTLDKYEGDAVMAFWGAPIPMKDHAFKTCLAALEMQKRLAALRTKWKKEGKPAIEVRCGINTGIMLVGNMGGKDHFDYTVIGDSVNLASRLEGANKQYHSKIMISDMTYQLIKAKVVVRELDLIQVKGKTEPVRVYELLGTSDMPMTDAQKQSLELYSEGLKLYRTRKWEEAVAYMQQARALDESCYAAQIYEERAGLYQLTPPPDEWNGVFVMTTK